MARRKEVLTTGDVAAICQVAPRTVSKWFDSGQLKGYRVPGSRDRRIPVDDLIRFMRSHGMPVGDLETGRPRVLVVSPDQEFRDSLLESLDRKSVFECAAAGSAFSAGLMAAKLAPNVMLVDTASPELGPFEAWVAVHHVEELREVKIIAITRDRSAVYALRESGFDACLVRPFEAREAADAIDAVIASNDVG